MSLLLLNSSLFSFKVDNLKEKFSFLYKVGYYLPTPPLRQDMTQGQFLSGV